MKKKSSTGVKSYKFLDTEQQSVLYELIMKLFMVRRSTKLPKIRWLKKLIEPLPGKKASQESMKSR